MSDETSSRRRGKIARCPRTVREELCRRLDDGQQGPQILAWVNAVPEVQALVADRFGGEPISDNNLSVWFKGGFLEWRREQIRVEETAAKAELSLRLTKAAGVSMSEGVVAVAAGRIMTELESAEGDALVKLAAGIAALRGTEQTAEKIGLARHRNKQRDEQLALERDKFERLAVGKFIDWAENKQAIEIATSNEPREVKMPQLMELMFGRRPDPAPGVTAT